MLLCLGSVMRVTIQLDAKPLGRAIEIHDVRAVAMLPAKLASIELAVYEVEPEEPLGKCGIVAEFFAAPRQRWNIVALLHSSLLGSTTPCPPPIRFTMQM